MENKLLTEIVEVFQLNEERTQFRLNGHCFIGISGHAFIPKGEDSKHKVLIKVIRSEKVFDEGDYDYYSRDDRSFSLPKIIPDYFEKKGTPQSSSLYLSCDMFIAGDMIEFQHNSRYDLANNWAISARSDLNRKNGGETNI